MLKIKAYVWALIYIVPCVQPQVLLQEYRDNFKISTIRMTWEMYSLSNAGWLGWACGYYIYSQVWYLQQLTFIVHVPSSSNHHLSPDHGLHVYTEGPYKILWLSLKAYLLDHVDLKSFYTHAHTKKTLCVHYIKILVKEIITWSHCGCIPFWEDHGRISPFMQYPSTMRYWHGPRGVFWPLPVM